MSTHTNAHVAGEIVDPWILALSVGGTVEVRSYPPDESVQLPSVLPSGARVQAQFPKPPRTFTAQIVYGTETSGFGYLVMPRGSGPLCMAFELDFEAEGPVDYGGGPLVYYRIVRPHESYPGMTVWQIGNYDVVTFEHLSLTEAIENLELCVFEVTAEGILIQPRDPRWRVREEALTVEAGGLHYRITEKTLNPRGEGASGRFGQFYRHNNNALLFFSDSAYAEIQRVAVPAPHAELAVDTDEALSFERLPASSLQELMRELSLTWLRASGAR